MTDTIHNNTASSRVGENAGKEKFNSCEANEQCFLSPGHHVGISTIGGVFKVLGEDGVYREPEQCFISPGHHAGISTIGGVLKVLGEDGVYREPSK